MSKRPVVTIGDMTSHGGAVITAAPTTTAAGKPVARMGDMVACPLCLGVYPIATGDPTLLVMGKPAARMGDVTACGATLISTQVSTSTI